MEPNSISYITPYKCRVCGLSYQNKTTFFLHTTQSLSCGNQRTTCDVCGKSTWSTRLAGHMLRHGYQLEPRTLKTCHKCGAEFKSEVGYADHMRWSMTCGTQKLACDRCGKVCGFRNALNRHLDVCGRPRRFHTGTDRRTEKYRRKNRSIPPGKAIYKCRRCGIAYSVKDNFLRHEKESYSCGKSRKTCDICGKSTGSNSKFRRHLKIHGIKLEPFKKSLGYHGKPDYYKCRECGLLFKKYGYFRYHILESKTCGKGGRICDICGKTIWTSFRFIGHLQTHEKSNQKPPKTKQKSEPVPKEIPGVVKIPNSSKNSSDYVLFKCSNCSFVTLEQRAMKIHRSDPKMCERVNKIQKMLNSTGQQDAKNAKENTESILDVSDSKVDLYEKAQFGQFTSLRTAKEEVFNETLTSENNARLSMIDSSPTSVDCKANVVQGDKIPVGRNSTLQPSATSHKFTFEEIDTNESMQFDDAEQSSLENLEDSELQDETSRENRSFECDSDVEMQTSILSAYEQEIESINADQPDQQDQHDKLDQQESSVESSNSALSAEELEIDACHSDEFLDSSNSDSSLLYDELLLESDGEMQTEVMPSEKLDTDVEDDEGDDVEDENDHAVVDHGENRNEELENSLHTSMRWHSEESLAQENVSITAASNQETETTDCESDAISSEPSDDLLKCSTCSFTTPSKAGMQTHKSDPSRCERVNKIAALLKSTKTNERQKPNKDKDFKCPDCFFSTKTKKDFHRHRQKLANCRRVNEMMKLRQVLGLPLEGNLNSVDPSGGSFNCPNCFYETKEPKLIRSHMNAKNACKLFRKKMRSGKI